MQEERDQSRSLQRELLESRRQSHAQAGPSNVQSRPTVSMPDVTDRLHARIQTAENYLTQQSTHQKGDVTPNAPPLPAAQWSFSQPLLQALPDTSNDPFSIHIKPREPPVFIGDKGQDVVSWLRTVEDYLECVTCSEC